MNGSTPYNTKGLWGGVVVNGELNTYDGDDLAEGIMDASGQGRDVYGAMDSNGDGDNDF